MNDVGAGPLLSLHEVSYGYGTQPVLDRVSLDVHRDDFLAIIGPNGGGKTTLVKLMLGLLQPWSGTIDRAFAPERGAVGYVPQHAVQDPVFPLEVADAVRMGRVGGKRFVARYTRDDDRRVGELLAELGLEALARRRVGELSGGEHQRVMLARALAGEPQLLVLDEPFASVDAESRATIQEILRRTNERVPVVLVTHDMSAVAADVRNVACINRELFYHGAGEVRAETLEHVYGCPVEMLAHGIPHRVLAPHTDQSHGPENG